MGEATPANPPAAFQILSHPFLSHCTLLESSLLRTSCRGAAPPPQPPGYVLDVLQRFNCTHLNHYFFKHHGGGCRPPQPPEPRRYFLHVLQRFNCTPIRSITSANIMERAAAPPTSPLLSILVFCFFLGIEMPSCLNHHLFAPVNPPATF